MHKVVIANQFIESPIAFTRLNLLKFDTLFCSVGQTLLISVGHSLYFSVGETLYISAGKTPYDYDYSTRLLGRQGVAHKKLHHHRVCTYEINSPTAGWAYGCDGWNASEKT